MTARLGRSALAPILVALAYFAGAELAFAIGTMTQMFAPFWPPNVVLLCVLLIVPARRWPLLILAALPAHVAAELGVAMPVPQALVAFACNVTVAVLGALLLRRLIGGPPWLGTLRDAGLYLLVTAVVAPGLAAFGGGAEPTMGDGVFSEYALYWWRWYLANALGSLTLTPVFLTWFAGGTGWFRSAPPRRQIEAGALVLGLVATCAMAFGVSPEAPGLESFLPALPYVPVPLLLWAAVRFGGRGASGAILVVTVVALWSAMRGEGLFAATAPGHSVLAMQLFLAMIAVPVLLLAALVEELNRTNRRSAAILAGISDGYYTVDRNWRIAVINEKAADWFGRDPEAAIGLGYEELVGESWVITKPLVRAAMEEGVPRRAEIQSTLHPGKWLNLHVYPSADGASVFFLDVTERKRIEASLRDSEARFRAMAETVPDILFTATAEGCDYMSPRFCTYTGLAPEAVLGLGWLEALAPESRLRILAARRRAAQSSNTFEEECRILGADGIDRWFVIRWHPIHNEAGQRKWFGAMTDIDDLKEAADALRALTGRLFAAQDDERRRIARELHDATAQNLAAAGLDLDRAARWSTGAAPEARVALQEARQLINQSLREMRTLSYLLHPPMLDQTGLASALRWYIDGFVKRSGIEVEISVVPELEKRRLPTEIEMALFRVVQEALTNVHRHSGASTAMLRLACEPGEADGERVVLDVVDCGAGMRPHAAERGQSDTSSGVGLSGMRERMRQVGGRLDIRSDANGTRLRAVAPLVDAAAEPPPAAAAR